MRACDLRFKELLGMDNKKGFPLFGSLRIMLMGGEPLCRFIEDLTTSVGYEQMLIILNRFGYEIGTGVAMYISELYDFDSQEEWLKASNVLYPMAGIAIEEFKEFVFNPEEKNISVTGIWRDSFEAEAWRYRHKELSPTPVCNILAGMTSGYITTVAGQKVLVREMTCQAQGNDFCTFEGRSIAGWGLTEKNVEQYFKLETIDNELDHMRTVIKQTNDELVMQRAEIRRLKKQTRSSITESSIIYRSESMSQALILAEKAAPTTATILIQGESGTGKEIVAKFIHEKSGREQYPFLAVNCAALPPNLLEAELFGYVKGAFTGAETNKKGLLAEAGKGTFFLDEIGDMPIDLQAKLIRALQEKEIRPVGGIKPIPIHTRIIAATNKDLKLMVVENRFREDLYYRLAVFPIQVIPLRQRKQDILLLARHFLSDTDEKHPGFSPEAIRRMEQYSWPGNVRELKNCVEYALILAGDERILPEHLPPSIIQDVVSLLDNLTTDFPTQKELDLRYTKLVLEHTGNKKKEAADILGIGTTTLWQRLKDIESMS